MYTFCPESQVLCEDTRILIRVKSRHTTGNEDVFVNLVETSWTCRRILARGSLIIRVYKAMQGQPQPGGSHDNYDLTLCRVGASVQFKFNLKFKLTVKLSRVTVTASPSERPDGKSRRACDPACSIMIAAFQLQVSDYSLDFWAGPGVPVGAGGRPTTPASRPSPSRPHWCMK